MFLRTICSCPGVCLWDLFTLFSVYTLKVCKCLDLHINIHQIYSLFLLPVTRHQGHVTTETLSSTSRSTGETLYSVGKHCVCCFAFAFAFLECCLHPPHGIYTLLHDLFTWHSTVFFQCTAKTWFVSDNVFCKKKKKSSNHSLNVM